MSAERFVEIDFAQAKNRDCAVSGDVFVSRRLDGGDRVVSVLADGMGSGIEAAVLASLTSGMALECVAGRIDARSAGEIVMDALPMDEKRKVSYCMFTLVDASLDGRASVIDHGNPAFILLRDGECVPIEADCLRSERWGRRELKRWDFETRIGDRIVFFSDGVTHSGLGDEGTPFGWGDEGVRDYATKLVEVEPGISARDLSRALLAQALRNDGGAACDDITCATLYFREPRRLLVLTGPPFYEERDREFAARIRLFLGRTAVCGGTTSEIVARELGLPMETDITNIDPDIPCVSLMPGIDLVTEGILTLGRVAEILEGARPLEGRRNGATMLAELMLRSDYIEFVVGRKINEAHQDPAFPLELDIRRNVVKKIVQALEGRYLKKTKVEFV
jgi:Serine phosphatase RsbU, regulator of sigma subunit